MDRCTRVQRGIPKEELLPYEGTAEKDGAGAGADLIGGLGGRADNSATRINFFYLNYSIQGACFWLLCNVVGFFFFFFWGLCVPRAFCRTDTSRCTQTCFRFFSFFSVFLLLLFFVALPSCFSMEFSFCFCVFPNGSLVLSPRNGRVPNARITSAGRRHVS